MKKKSAILFVGVLACVSVSFLLGAAAEEKRILIHLHLFQGTGAGSPPRGEGAELITPESHPSIAALKAKLGLPHNELTPAVIEALLEAFDLESVVEYFSFSQEWKGRPGPIMNPELVHKSYRFHVGLNPKWRSPGTIDLDLSLFKSHGSPKMDPLVDRRIALALGEPFIVRNTVKDEEYFLLHFAVEAPPKVDPSKEWVLLAPISPPKQRTTLIPAFPEELRSQVWGEVELEVVVEPTGTVGSARVVRPLHPYLDFAAVQAVRQWTFEPAVQNGAAVPVSVKITLKFNPVEYRLMEEREAAATDAPPGGLSGRLAQVLAGTADYCRNLETAALSFICEESIDEIEYNFASEPKWNSLIVSERGPAGRVTLFETYPQWDPQRTEKRKFRCDYLFVKNNDRIGERRVLLQDGRRTMPDRSRILEEERYTALNPVLAAVGIFGRDRQRLSDFRIIGADSARGKKCDVVEAIPKSGNTWGVDYAKIWVERETFRIVQIEIQGVPIEGYENVLRESMSFAIRPSLVTTHHYDVEKAGLLYPSRTSIRVEYPQGGTSMTARTLKLKIDFVREKHRFFEVATDVDVLDKRRPE